MLSPSITSKKSIETWFLFSTRRTNGFSASHLRDSHSASHSIRVKLRAVETMLSRGRTPSAVSCIDDDEEEEENKNKTRETIYSQRHTHTHSRTVDPTIPKNCTFLQSKILNTIFFWKTSTTKQASWSCSICPILCWNKFWSNYRTTKYPNSALWVLHCLFCVRVFVAPFSRNVLCLPPCTKSNVCTFTSNESRD